ncbi:DNAJ heat shock N-terminal domain-containing family protein [Hibiscus syriacus]|uniref:DNAJ heat shock N-terminal domain-containing family protein n=1 Tax=Hibiscus syriacus TaxID=106335 RepID=A0A6A2X118_HIBSY|nr:DNAJ heat shock N-terminal domain-containing family protein [Hibiscus syriacus]
MMELGFTGRHSKFVNRLVKEEVDAALEESGEGEGIHERVLRVNTKDYGKYDPSPALVKPPFKLIPN